MSLLKALLLFFLQQSESLQKCLSARQKQSPLSYMCMHLRKSSAILRFRLKAAHTLWIFNQNQDHWLSERLLSSPSRLSRTLSRNRQEEQLRTQSKVKPASFSFIPHIKEKTAANLLLC